MWASFLLLQQLDGDFVASSIVRVCVGTNVLCPAHSIVPCTPFLYLFFCGQSNTGV